VRLPDEVVEEYRAKAKGEGRTLAGLMTIALRGYLYGSEVLQERESGDGGKVHVESRRNGGRKHGGVRRAQRETQPESGAVDGGVQQDSAVERQKRNLPRCSGVIVSQKFWALIGNPCELEDGHSGPHGPSEV
jgi:hypothetical protein